MPLPSNSNLRPHGEAPENRRQRAFDGLRRVVTINRSLSAYLIVLVGIELALHRRADVARDAMVSLPFVLVLLLAAAKLSRNEPFSGWLLVSGWTRAVLALVSALALRASLKQPVEVLWVFLAAGLTGCLVSAAWYELIDVAMPDGTSSSSALNELTGASPPRFTVTLLGNPERRSRTASSAPVCESLRHLLRIAAPNAEACRRCPANARSDSGVGPAVVLPQAESQTASRHRGQTMAISTTASTSRW
jgi:hypothetical protein